MKIGKTLRSKFYSFDNYYLKYDSEFLIKINDSGIEHYFVCDGLIIDSHVNDLDEEISFENI